MRAPAAPGQVLLEFPCELVSAVVAGRWAASRSPFAPWMAGYQLRAVMAGVVTAIVRPLLALHNTLKPENPFAPWMAGYQLRAVMAGVVTAIVRPLLALHKP